MRLAAVCCFLIWLNFFYWMRLTPLTAFYIKLSLETLKDILQFLFLYLMLTLMFATCQLILQRYQNVKAARDPTTEYMEIIQTLTPSDIVNAWLSYWLLGLGEFYMDAFSENKDSEMEWTIFVLATFITNVVFLNMLIAIMGDTFARVTENRAHNTMIEQTNFNGDFISVVKKDPNFDKCPFLYIVTPIGEEGAGGAEW